MRISDSFRQTILGRLADLQEELKLGCPEALEDQELAVAPVFGFDDLPRHRFVLVTAHPGVMRVEVRQVLQCSSRGAQPNRTLQHLLRLLVPREENLTPEQFMTMACAADIYRSNYRTTDDLLAMIVVGTNDVFVRTRAGVDFFDGEVFVDTVMPCEFKDVPESFEPGLRAVLRHAQVLMDIESFVREQLTHEPSVPGPWMRRIVDRAAIEANARDVIANGRGPGEAEADDDLWI